MLNELKWSLTWKTFSLSFCSQEMDHKDVIRIYERSEQFKVEWIKSLMKMTLSHPWNLLTTFNGVCYAWNLRLISVSKSSRQAKLAGRAAVLIEFIREFDLFLFRNNWNGKVEKLFYYLFFYLYACLGPHDNLRTGGRGMFALLPKSL